MSARDHGECRTADPPGKTHNPGCTAGWCCRRDCYKNNGTILRNTDTPPRGGACTSCVDHYRDAHTVTVTLSMSLIDAVRGARDRYSRRSHDNLVIEQAMEQADRDLASEVIRQLVVMPAPAPRETTLGPIETSLILPGPPRWARVGTIAMPPARVGALVGVRGFEPMLLRDAIALVPARDASFQALLRGPFEYVRVAYVHDTPAGVIGYDVTSIPQLMVYVLPFFRRRGIGTMLVTNALRHYSSPTVWMGSEDAHRFWTRFEGKVRST